MFELFIANLDDNIREFADNVLVKKEVAKQLNSKELVDEVLSSSKVYNKNSLTNQSL